MPKLDATAPLSAVYRLRKAPVHLFSVLKMCFLFHPELCAAVSTSRQERRMQRRSSASASSSSTDEDTIASVCSARDACAAATSCSAGAGHRNETDGFNTCSGGQGGSRAARRSDQTPQPCPRW